MKFPISFSFKDKLLIDTPVVKLTLSFFCLITSIDFAEDICEMWYLQLNSSSNDKSLSIIIFSAKSGIPVKPNFVAIIPSLTKPFIDN